MERLLPQHPGDETVLLVLGGTLLGLGETARVEGLLHGHPREGPLCSALGHRVQELGWPSQAEVIFRRAREVDPSDQEAWKGRAKVPVTWCSLDQDGCSTGALPQVDLGIRFQNWSVRDELEAHPGSFRVQ